MGDLERGVAEDLVTQPAARAIEIGQLLGCEQHADAGLAAPREQRQHVVGVERGELVDRHHRRAARRPSRSVSRAPAAETRS